MAAALALGAGLEHLSEQIDAGRFAPSGAMVRVGSRRLYVQCAGRGAPGIVLEAGLGDDSTVWDKVFPGLNSRGRTCRYDRAGLGWSSREGATDSPDQLASDLETVLRAAALKPPYILVGHSFGGLLVRIFASHHRGEVAGVVLIDSAHEDQFDPPYSLPNEVSGWRTDPTPILASLGVWRAVDLVHPKAALQDGPVERALRLRADRYWTLMADSRNMSSFEAAARQSSSLEDVPLAVVTATTKPRKYLPAWQALQIRLAHLSTCSIQLFSPRSSHYVQKDEPAVILTAVDWVNRQARSSCSHVGETSKPLQNRP